MGDSTTAIPDDWWRSSFGASRGNRRERSIPIGIGPASPTALGDRELVEGSIGGSSSLPPTIRSSLRPGIVLAQEVVEPVVELEPTTYRLQDGPSP
jgi:hypothetical protein